MPSTIVASPGDSLCSIAVAFGFVNCQPLRDDPGNASIVNHPDHPGQVQPGDIVTIPDLRPNEVDKPNEQKHRFKRKGVPLGTVRFVHGSRTKHYADDDTLGVLNISNMQTDQVGTGDGSTTITAAQHFEARADADPDTFKVEVRQPKGSGTLRVLIDALRPVLTAGVVTGHQEFPGDRDSAGTEAFNRSLNVDCSKQGGSDRWRSSYLRLVVDDLDKDSLFNQTLLVTEMFDEGDPDVEILDQVVRATFVIPTCTGSPDKAKCRSVAEIPVGVDPKRIKIAVTILRDRPQSQGGTPVADPDVVRRRLMKWGRRVYAQASLSMKIVEDIHVVDPVGNMVSISNDNGARAAGDGQLSFTVALDGQPAVTIGPITPAAGDDPTTTANALAALVPAPFTAVVATNPATTSTAIGSADILITSGDQRVTVDNPVSNDSRQRLALGIIDPAAVDGVTDDNMIVGSIHERAVFRNFDTGDDRIDLFIIRNLTHSGNDAESFFNGHQIAPTKPGAPKIRRSCISNVNPFPAGDAFPFAIPHEFGHILMELTHPDGAGVDRQLMNHFWSATHAHDGHNRIRDANIHYPLPVGNFNQVSRLRSEDAVMGLLENW